MTETESLSEVESPLGTGSGSETGIYTEEWIIGVGMILKKIGELHGYHSLLRVTRSR